MYSLILDIVQRASPGVLYPPPHKARPASYVFLEMPARNEPSMGASYVFLEMPARNEPSMGQVTFFSKCRPVMSLPRRKLRFFSKCRPVFRGGIEEKKKKNAQ